MTRQDPFYHKDSVLLAIEALERVTKQSVDENGKLVPRSLADGNLIDLARKLHREVGELLDDLEAAATQPDPEPAPEPEVKKPWQFDRDRHGSLFDRGGADSYYRRQPDPHYGGVGGDSGQRTPVSDPESVAEYDAGYLDNEQSGSFKD